MNRLVQSEILDTLSPDDPRYPALRRDLARLNSWMRTAQIMSRALRNDFNGDSPKKITELGAGDGTFLLHVAKKLTWPNVTATLLDRQNVVTPKTFSDFAKLGWRAETLTADAFAWAQTGNPADIVIANLFLHHFDDAGLSQLLRAISARANFFIALEPHRFRFPFLFHPLFRVIGCDAVTRHDATVSIRAGFVRAEISALWPDKKNWQVIERRAGLFSHLFVARKIN